MSYFLVCAFLFTLKYVVQLEFQFTIKESIDIFKFLFKKNNCPGKIYYIINFIFLISNAIFIICYMSIYGKMASHTMKYYIAVRGNKL